MATGRVVGSRDFERFPKILIVAAKQISRNFDRFREILRVAAKQISRNFEKKIKKLEKTFKFEIGRHQTFRQKMRKNEK